MIYASRNRTMLVEAFQLTRESRQDESTWPAWLRAAWKVDAGEVGLIMENFPSKEIFIKVTSRHGFLGGCLTVFVNDWIVRAQGKLYPCRPDIFEKRYEPAK